VTEYCWVSMGRRDLIASQSAASSPSGIVAAIGERGEFASHLRAHASTALTTERTACGARHITIYCGSRFGADCFQVAETILSESQGKVSAEMKHEDAMMRNVAKQTGASWLAF